MEVPSYADEMVPPDSEATSSVMDGRLPKSCVNSTIATMPPAEQKEEPELYVTEMLSGCTVCSACETCG